MAGFGQICRESDLLFEFLTEICAHAKIRSIVYDQKFLSVVLVHTCFYVLSPLEEHTLVCETQST